MLRNHNKCTDCACADHRFKIIHIFQDAGEPCFCPILIVHILKIQTEYKQILLDIDNNDISTDSIEQCIVHSDACKWTNPLKCNTKTSFQWCVLQIC